MTPTVVVNVVRVHVARREKRPALKRTKPQKKQNIFSCSLSLSPSVCLPFAHPSLSLWLSLFPPPEPGLVRPRNALPSPIGFFFRAIVYLDTALPKNEKECCLARVSHQLSLGINDATSYEPRLRSEHLHVHHIEFEL